MKMKITELLEKITPLPWTPFSIEGKHGIDCDGRLPVVCHVVDQYRGEHLNNKAYIAHACNNFPKLLEALENLNEIVDWLSKSGNLKSPIEPHPYGLAVIQAKQDARSALTQAREVKG